MNYPFATLQPDYDDCLSRMVITRVASVDATVARLVRYIDAGRYDAGCKATGVPVPWAAASFEREASSNFNLNPAQGWPLGSRSQWIPHNGPFADWTTAQVAAYDLDGLQNVGATNWTWARACYEGEIFNGLGYRAHRIHSPYLWAGTNIYQEGKYVADGVWSATAVDQQLGIVPMMVEIIKERPALALASPLVAPSQPAPVIPPPPAPVPEGHHDAIALHAALNKLLALDPPFPANDDNFDRFTTQAVKVFQQKHGLAVDGIAGPATWTVIDSALKAA